MASGGYGRGGRGAALLKALNQPVRKPGVSSPPHGDQQPSPTVPVSSSVSAPTGPKVSGIVLVIWH